MWCFKRPLECDHIKLTAWEDHQKPNIIFLLYERWDDLTQRFIYLALLEGCGVLRAILYCVSFFVSRKPFVAVGRGKTPEATLKYRIWEVEIGTGNCLGLFFPTFEIYTTRALFSPWYCCKSPSDVFVHRHIKKISRNGCTLTSFFSDVCRRIGPHNVNAVRIAGSCANQSSDRYKWSIQELCIPGTLENSLTLTK